MMTKQKLAAFAVAMMAAALSGCGSTPPFEQNSTSPPNVAELRYGPNLLDPRLVGAARDDYYESMDRHFNEGESSFAAHPRHYGGWFKP